MKRYLRLVGKRVRLARKARRLSQEKLSELADMHPTYISDIENGKVNASITSFFAIAKALGIPLAELVDVPSSKTDPEMDKQIMEMLITLRSLGKRKQTIFLSAANGMLTEIKSQ